jgi:hypothetical protein
MLSFSKVFSLIFKIFNIKKKKKCMDVKISHDDGGKNFTPPAPTPLP